MPKKQEFSQDELQKLKDNTYWFEQVSPTECEVQCCGKTHKISWYKGKLILQNHFNYENEKILSALAGQEYFCLRVLEAWKESIDLIDTPVILGQYMRMPSLIGKFPTTAIVATKVHPVTFAFTGPEGPVSKPGFLDKVSPQRRNKIESVIQQANHARTLGHLSKDLLIRLALSNVTRVERRWQRDQASAEDIKATSEPVRVQAEAALKEFIKLGRNLSPQCSINISCTVISPNDSLWVSGRIALDSAKIEVGLPLSWLTRVWAWKLSLVGNYFIVDILKTLDDQILQVLTLELEPFGPRVDRPRFKIILIKRNENLQWESISSN